MNNYFKTRIIQEQENLYQKAAFPYETAVHAWMSESVSESLSQSGGVKEVTDTGY